MLILLEFLEVMLSSSEICWSVFITEGMLLSPCRPLKGLTETRTRELLEGKIENQVFSGEDSLICPQGM